MSLSHDLMEEVEVLRSIYSETQVQFNGLDELIYRDEERNITLTFVIPPSYPKDEVMVEISSIRTKIPILEKIKNAVKVIICEYAAEVVMFRIIEGVKELIDSCTESFLVPATPADELSSDEPKERLQLNTQRDCDFHLNIVHGPVTTEMKSSFQSHLAAVQSMTDVKLFRETVIGDKKVCHMYDNYR